MDKTCLKPPFPQGHPRHFCVSGISWFFVNVGDVFAHSVRADEQQLRGGLVVVSRHQSLQYFNFARAWERMCTGFNCFMQPLHVSGHGRGFLGDARTPRHHVRCHLLDGLHYTA